MVCCLSQTSLFTTLFTCHCAFLQAWFEADVVKCWYAMFTRFWETYNASMFSWWLGLNDELRERRSQVWLERIHKERRAIFTEEGCQLNLCHPQRVVSSTPQQLRAKFWLTNPSEQIWMLMFFPCSSPDGNMQHQVEFAGLCVLVHVIAVLQCKNKKYS